jgi:broad specificity phosphatase PhoE
LIAERFAFTCDIGSRSAMLRARWPDITFDHLPDPWWPKEEESVEILARRCEIFCDRIAREAWSEIAVVTHWGFIKAVTGSACQTERRCESTRLNPILQRNCSICRIRPEARE